MSSVSVEIWVNHKSYVIETFFSGFPRQAGIHVSLGFTFSTISPILPYQRSVRRLSRLIDSGVTPQISPAYSAMVRSLENLPMPAVLRIDLRAHS